MNEKKFWELIQTSIVESKKASVPQDVVLKQLLFQLHAKQLEDFVDIWAEKAGYFECEAFENYWMQKSGLFSDDMFLALRWSIVGMGKEIFERVLTNYEEILSLPGEPYNEELIGVVFKVLAQKKQDESNGGHG